MLQGTLGHLGRARGLSPTVDAPVLRLYHFSTGPLRSVDVFSLPLCLEGKAQAVRGAGARQVPRRVAQQPEEWGRSPVSCSCSGAFSFKTGESLGCLAEDSPPRPALVREAGPPSTSTENPLAFGIHFSQK